jgi:hypothetical protein
MDDIRSEVERFLHEDIESVRQLEVLLHVRAGAPRAYTADEVSAELRSGPVWTAQQLEDLRAKGLLEELREPPAAYRYAPGDHAALVDEVESLFARRKTTVIELIFGGPEPAARAGPGVRRRT